MSPNDLPFEQFFAEKIKERGVSLKKLSEMTGIAPAHIESLLRGDYESMPSAPYFHGYLTHLGAVLDFDGEEWWVKLKKEGVIKNSGELDTMPRNRFIKQSPPKYLWWIRAGVIVLIYLAFQAPRIFGKPTLTVTPQREPVCDGIKHAHPERHRKRRRLALSRRRGREQEPIIIAADGSWQKRCCSASVPTSVSRSPQKSSSAARRA